MDVLTKNQRKLCMSRIKGKDTKPEMIVRKRLHALGYRYRLHVRKLPGCPDIVFPSRNKVIFVHGCFWHRHKCKYGRATPATRKNFWKNKFDRTIQRDRRNTRLLRKYGWEIYIVWECQVYNLEKTTKAIVSFLEDK